MKKKRQLKNMNINEVSLVDRPANKRKFLLIKREDGEITELTIKTDGTSDGTTLSVNGGPVDALKSFWFSLWPADDFDEGMMSGSYTVSETDGAEFDRETTFNLKKGMETMELGKVLKSLGISPDSVSEEKVEDLESLLKFIDLMPPTDAASALNIIKASLVKEEASEQEEQEEETPAETADMPPEKVVEIRSAMAELNAMLPESEQSELKTEEQDKMDRVLAAIEGLKKGDGEKPKEDEDTPPDTVADILKRLSKVEETTGVAKDEDEEDEDGDLDTDAVLTSEENLKKYGTRYPKLRATWAAGLLRS